MLELPPEVARRFVLGKSGLWPGRRWRAASGTERAMRALEQLQLDPLVLVARAHDLILQGRVLDYRPGDWAVPTYGRRRFSTGAAGSPSGRWTSCRTGGSSCGAS